MQPRTADVDTSFRPPVASMMTAVGAASIPGARSDPRVSPLEVDASRYVGTPKSVSVIPFVYEQSVPHVGAEATFTVTTPLPDGNFSVFDDRWAVIEADTLPVGVDLAEHHPDVTAETLVRPPSERADKYRIDEQLDDLVAWSTGGWDLDVDVEAQAGW